MSMRPRRTILTIFVMAIVATGLPACASTPDSAGLHMMAMDQLPPEVQAAPITVRTAYQFAAANPEVMRALPCYCGCGGIGHTSNYDCYVADVDPNGTIRFDGHALGCSICVDITVDAMRLLKDGKSVPEIRVYVDATYAKYGTSNME